MNTINQNRSLKILFIAYDFPPSTSAGSVRIANLTRQLHNSKNEITILSVKKESWVKLAFNDEISELIESKKIKLIETNFYFKFLDSNFKLKYNNFFLKLAYGGFRKLIELVHFEAQIGWFLGLQSIINKIEAKDFDLILATGNPYVSFYTAFKISEKTKIPYVLDYRDLWSSNPQRIKKTPKWQIKLERKIIEHSSGISVVSPSMAKILRKNFLNCPSTFVLTNGFDPNDFVKVNKFQFNNFSIVYAGTFYPPKIVIDPIFKALMKLVNKFPELHGKWKFYYWGPGSNYLKKECLNYELNNFIEINEMVPRNLAREIINGADLSIVITSVFPDGDNGDRGFITSKVFDSLAVGTNLLVIAPNESDLIEILNNAKNGKVFTGSQVDEISDYLADRINSGNAKREPPLEYTWANLIVPYNRFLNDCAKLMKNKMQ